LFCCCLSLFKDSIFNFQFQIYFLEKLIFILIRYQKVQKSKKSKK
jgi:hypothetical protein